MESYIQITKLNDFIFCPKSLYFHGLFENFEEKTYKATPQLVGKIAHETIENSTYSTRKDVLQGLSVYSEKYGLCGKIDIFDVKKGYLRERKYKIKKIYDGYKFQLYAQMFAMQEMGYKVKKMFLYSMSDNKKYPISIPNKKEIKIFENLVSDVKSFRINDAKLHAIESKCANCIYKPLCH